MNKVAIYVANLRAGKAHSAPDAEFAAASKAAADISNGRVTLYQKCRLITDDGSDVYWAVPAYEREGEAVRARFDFVEERTELWAGHDLGRQPCRPVVQLFGFLRVEVDGDPVYNIAIARNLIPHADSTIDEDGNPWHPRWGVLHCLWQFQR